uniref:ATP-dependent RNA helicase n=1 Tax=Caenorhabditis tropicalis TaxID=1561998 RepID=A0A1I7V4L0_9PELO
MPQPWITEQTTEERPHVGVVDLTPINPPVYQNTVNFKNLKNNYYSKDTKNRRNNLPTITAAKKESDDLNRFCEEQTSVVSGDGSTCEQKHGMDVNVCGALSDSRISKNLERAHVTVLNAVQLHSLKLIRDGQGIIVEAPTGIGKTYAFLIPAIEKSLKERAIRDVQPKKASPTVLVIAPTGTLAKQLFNRCELILGLKMMDGVDPIHDIRAELLIAEHRFVAEDCDIAFCTMGKLKASIEEKSLCLDHLKMIVLDEADKMIDNMAFGMDIKWVLDQLSEEVMTKLQSCFFSATYERDVNQAITLKDIQVRMLDGKPWKLVHCPRLTGYISQNVIKIGNDEKPFRPPWHKKLVLIKNLIDQDLENTGCRKEGPYQETITIFCETVGRVAQVTTALRLLGYKFEPVCRTVTKVQQEITLNDLEFKKIQGIVCTNVMARGIDVSSVKHTIIMEMSTDFDTYKHRIGRVGRDGSGGKATVLIDHDHLMSGPLANLLDALYEFMQESGEVPAWMKSWYDVRYPQGYQ